MAGTATPIFPQTIKNIAARIANSDATNKVTIATGALNGSKIEGLQVTSDDSTQRTLSLWLSKGGVDYLLGIYTIASNQGNTAGSNSFGILGNVANSPAPQTTGMTLPLDALGNKYLMLENGASLKASVSSTMTSGKF
jgi:hypothetical protein